jgi:transcription elongation factor Elf1
MPTPKPINCPVCESLLKVMIDHPDTLHLVCLDCGTKVAVPHTAWSKKQSDS